MKSYKHNPNLFLSSSSPYRLFLSFPLSASNLKRQRFTPLSFFIFFIFLCFSSATSMADSDSDSGPVVPTTRLVTFLQRVQLTALRSYPKNQTPDPKSYVDLSLKLPHDLSSVESAFQDLTNESRDLSVPVEKLERFVDEYFDGAGEDLVHHEPEDFVSDPSDFLLNVENKQVRDWAREVHCLWRKLSCKVSGSVRVSPDRHTLLPLPEPVIIPGSRFREVYYWDSYWVIKLSVFPLLFLIFSYITCRLRNNEVTCHCLVTCAFWHVQRTYDE